MLEKLKDDVLKANLSLVSKDLVISTWGNVSGFDPEKKLLVIKASGVHYDEMEARHMVVVDLEGNVVKGEYRPSTDTPTHVELYKDFMKKGYDLRGVVHTHSQYATTWAQFGRDIPCYGTTHIDYFYGDIPCTRLMTSEEIQEAYEVNTGKVIIERFKNIKYNEMQAVLVHSHAPFTWGKTPADAVIHSQVLEYISKMACFDYMMSSGELSLLQRALMDKHYNRKFGKNAYYGQIKEN